MDANTDPVRAHDELRVQAALLRTPEFMAQFDPEKFAQQLERIATVIAQQPAAVDEERMKRDIAAQAAEIEALRAKVGALTARLGDIYQIADAALAAALTAQQRS